MPCALGQAFSREGPFEDRSQPHQNLATRGTRFDGKLDLLAEVGVPFIYELGRQLLGIRKKVSSHIAKPSTEVKVRKRWRHCIPQSEDS